MVSKFKKLFQYSRQDLFILLKSWMLFCKWDLLISFVPYRTWRDKINQPINYRDSHAADYSEITNLIRLSEIAGRNHYRHMNCLRRCMVQKQLLASKGIDTELHFGVYKSERLHAHCWLTYESLLINDTNESLKKYQQLDNTEAVMKSLC